MHERRIAHVSQWMALLSLALAMALLAINIGYWASPGFFGDWGGALIPPLPPVTDLVWWQRVGGFLLSSVSLAALIIGLLNLRALFRGYARGEFFTPQAAIHLGAVGKAVIFWVALRFVTGPLLSLWLKCILARGID